MYGNLKISHKGNSSKNLDLDPEIFNKYSTPVIKKEKSSEVETEMRRTYRIKPPLISSKFPSAFEIIKVDNNKQIQNQLLQPLKRINEKRESSSSESIKKRNSNSQMKSYNDRLDRLDRLEPINLKIVRQKQIMKTKLSNELKLIDAERKLEEEREKNLNQKNIKIQKNKKFILKPIEIRDPSRKNNKNIFDRSSMSPTIRISLETEKNFAKTSIVNFKILENLDLKNLEKNEKYSSEISKIEKNLKMKPGEIMKMYKNLNENEDKYQMIKSYYTNNIKHSLSTIPTNKESSIKNLKLGEMITLANINSSRTCGNIKKMLHVPSFKIYTVRVFLFFIYLLRLFNRKFR